MSLSITIKNRVGESTDSCLIPQEIGKQFEMHASILTLAVAVEYQWFSKRHNFPFTPTEYILSSRNGISIESKADLLKNWGEAMENHYFKEFDGHRGKADASVATRNERVFSLSFMYRYD